jgi:hypothetical protein
VIYPPVPVTLKEAADSYASQHGKTLTSAVVDLLERGLTAASSERSIAGHKGHPYQAASPVLCPARR